MAFSKKVSVLLEGKETVSTAAKKAGDSVEDMGNRGKSALSGLGGAIVVANQALELMQKAAEAVRQVMERIEEGGRVNQIEQAFRSMARGVGASADEVIANLRRMSAETVSQADLMASANRAMLFNIPVDELDELMGIARASATATGAEVSQMFDDIVTGIARSSPMILDNLGLTIKIGEATESYAASLGKTATELTAAERQQATLNAVLKSGAELSERVGEAAAELTDLERFQQYQAAWADLKNELNGILAETFGPMLEKTAQMLQNLRDAVRENRSLRAAQKAAEEGTALLEEQILNFQGKIEDARRQIAVISGAMRAAEGSGGRVRSMYDQGDLERAQSILRGYESGLQALLNQQSQQQQAAADEQRRLAEQAAAEQRAAAKAAQDAADAQKEAARQASLAAERLRIAREQGRAAQDNASGVYTLGNLPSGPLLDLTGFNDALMTGYDLIMEFGDEVEESTKHLIKFSEKADKATDMLALFEPRGYGTTAQAGMSTESDDAELTAMADAAAYALGQLDGALLNAANQVGTLSALLDPLNTLMDGYLQVTGQLLNNAYAPLVGIIVQVGKLLGGMLAPLIEITSGAIKVLAKGFVWFYNNILRRVANLFISVFNVIFDIFRGLAQVVVDVANTLIEFANKFRRESKEKDLMGNPFGDARKIDEGHLGAIDLGDLANNARDYTYTGPTYSGPTGSDNTTVNRPPDIYIYQTFNGPIIGESGMEEFGRMVVDALIEYTDIGGNVNVIIGEGA